ncbi:MAG TPA: CotH kinase family protein [Chitinophaga sp.]|nr:CotH kinase family protein [Chitinophaga sp.]
MKKTIILLIAFSLGLSACRKEAQPEISDPIAGAEVLSSDKDILQFKFEAKNNPQQLLEDMECHISVADNQIIGWVPYLGSDRSLVATFGINGTQLTVQGTTQESGVSRNDYTRPVTFTVKAQDSTTREYTVTLYSFTGLPVLYLETEAPITSKEDYVKGKVIIDANSRYPQAVTEMAMEMRGRGNSTWLLAKKPYRIKLDKKAEMLGMPAAKKWELLANFADKTLIRNYLGLEVARRFGTAFTPRARYVEVVLNGEYMGNYLMTDHVEIGPTRVNIPELSPSTPEADVSGGYLLEVDEKLDEVNWFRSTLQVPFTIKSPENITIGQLNYIKNYLQQIENALYSPGFLDPQTGYSQYINEETFINWYLVNELMKNNDAIFFSSVFMYKERNGKLSMGPVWDFDLAAGNNIFNGNNSPYGWWIRQAIWINRMFDDPAFKQKVKDRWNALKNEQVNTLFAFINETAEYLKRSQKENFNKWGVLYNYTWVEPTVMGSYESEVQYMKQWLQKRINWMDAAINAN